MILKAMNVNSQKNMDVDLRREDETIDDILGGRLKILQKKRGYRFSIDSLLLAHFVRLKRGDSVVDLGTGSGILLLILSQRFRCGRLVGVEIQEELADMARRSAEMNNLKGKIKIISGDIRKIKTFLNPQSFDVAIFNPPYRKLNTGRINPDRGKAVARHEIRGKLEDFLLAARYTVKGSGYVYTIYPATRMAELFSRMRDCGIAPGRIRIVHSRRSSAGEFLLMEGRKGGGDGIKVLPPLFIYEEDEGYTEEIKSAFMELSAPV